MISDPTKTNESRGQAIDITVVKPGNDHIHKPKKAKSNNTFNKRNSFIALFVVLIAALGFLYYFHHHTKHQTVNQSISPVPEKVSKGVNFPMYYTDPKLLPAGFSLNTSSFSSGNNAAVFSVKHGTNKLVVTEQQKPTDQEIKTFYEHQMPIHTEIDTKVGVATVAALNMQNVVSLPTKDSTWLLITYPDNVTKDQLKQFLNSIHK